MARGVQQGYSSIRCARLDGRLALRDVRILLMARRDAGLKVRRVEERNRAKDGSNHLSFDVTREMFDFVESLWEPPTDTELAASNGVRVS
jgi:hypothetical protein